MTAHRCQARQYSDQMICHACGLVWDMNDPDPPECQKDDRHGDIGNPWKADIDAQTKPALAG